MGWDEHMIRCSGCGQYDCECGSQQDNDDDDDDDDDDE